MEKLTGPWNEYQPSAPATDSGPWDEFKPQAEQPKSYGLKDFGGDLASVVTKGVMAVPQAAVGLADIATGGRAGKALEDIGVRFNDANQIADSWKSDALKAQQKDFQQAEGLAGKTAAALRSPGLLMSVVGESVPSMFAGGALAKGVGLAAPALAGRAGLAAAGEGAVMAGSQAESIRQQTDDGLLTAKQSALAAGTGLAGGAIGALGAKAAKSLGIGDVDTMIANGATQGAAREGLGLVSRVGRGALSEGVLEELPQSLTETALGNIALDRNVTQGMDEAAVLGTLSGGLMGGAAGALSRPAVKPSQAMGLDPAAGPLSRAAATAVDSGATPTIQPEQVNAEQTQADPSVAQAPDEGQPGEAGPGVLSNAGPTGGSSLEQPQRDQRAGTPPATGRTDDGLTADPLTPAPEPLPLEARSLDELRQSLRNAQDQAIRKTVAAEIRRRRESMPDPLQPQKEITLEPQAAETQQEQPKEQTPPAAAPAVLGQPLTDTGTNMLGRGADPLQSLIQEENNVRRAADSLRNGSNGSSGAGPNLSDAGLANDVGVPDGTAGTAAPVIPESVQSSAGEQSAPGQAALSEPDAKTLTPKQYHEAKLKYLAKRNGVSLSEVREFYGDETAQKNDQQEWVNSVREAFKSGEQLDGKMLDRLEELRPGAVASFNHDFPNAKLPDGYFIPSVRKAAEERKKIRLSDEREVKKRVEQEFAEKVAAGEQDRPPRWRQNALQAGKVARTLGLDPKGKRLAQIVAEIDAKDGKSSKPSDDAMVANAVKKADELGLKGADRKQWVADSLSASFGMTADEVADIPSVVAALKSRPSKDSKTKATERFVESVVRQAEAANVQNAPQAANDGQAQAAPVEASTAARGDAASNGAVSAAGQDSGVRADGVSEGAPTVQQLRDMPIGTKEQAKAYADGYAKRLAAEAKYGQGRFIGANEKPWSVANADLAEKNVRANEAAELNYWQKPYEEAIKEYRFQGLPRAKWEAERKRRGLPADLSKNQPKADTSAEPVQETAKTEQVAKAPAEPVNPIPPAKKVDRAASLRKAEWKKNPLRSFLGQHGLSLDLAKEFAPGITERRKAMVGGYGPIFRKAGKSLDLLAEIAREEGFISADQDATDLYELVAAVFRGERVAPMFTADAAQDEMQARMEAMQEQSNAEFEDFIGMESADPFGPLNDDEIAATGYDAADDKIKAEVDALIAMADSLGIDTETIREDAARETAEQSEQVYYVQARRILTQAIAQSTGSSGNDQAVESRPGQREEAKPRSNADRGTDSGGKGEQSGLTAPTRRDIEAQQASTEQADKLDERAQVKRESELGDTSFMTGFSGDGRQDNTGSLFDVADQSSTETTYTPAPDAQKKAVTAFADRLSKNRDSFVLMDAVKPSGARQQEAQSVANLAKTMFGREAVFVKFKGRPLFNGAVSTTDPGKIFVNIESARPMMAVLGHELLHELRKSNPAAYNQLAKTLKTVTKDDYIYEALLKKKYRDQGLNWTPQDISEELYGDIVGDNFMDPKFWEAIAGDKPIFAKQLYRAVMNWLDKIASMFKRVKVRQDGSMVLTLAEQADGSRPFGTQKYLQDIEAARAAVAQAMGQFKQGGEGKDALAISDRQDQTDTPAFKRWFGESKVVDSAGKPLRVFHGTRREFNVFEPMKPRGAFGNPVGIYFSSDKSEAQQFAEDADGATDEKSRVVEAYLKIESDKDGIIRKRADGTTEYIVFRPEQIKSATGNNGNFDPANPDIRFSIADAVEQIKQFDVKTAPKNTWAHYRGMAMQALGRRQIVDLYAEELPQLEHYNDLVQRMDAEKNETGAEADKLAQDWSKLKDGEDRKLAELMHDATLSQVDPSKAMPAGFSKKDYDALKGRYDAMTPEAKRLFGEARDMYADHFRAVQKAIKERIERSEMSDGQKRQIMAKMDEELFKELKGVYFPLARFGQYVIVVKDANGEVKSVTRAETVSEAEEARKELMKAFPKLMGNTVGKVLKQAEFNAGRDAVGKGFMADLMGALDAKGVDDELRDTVAQLYLSSLPDLSWAKHGIHRKGTPGFSQDARRAFAQNMFHGARYLAKLRYADQLQDDLIEMQEHVKAYEGVEEYDSIEAQQVVDEMVKRHEILMNPKSSPVSTALTSFGFLFHMGLSPASAMVNLTQTALVAFPQMGAKWGFTKSSAALLKASEEVVRAKNDLATVLKGDELAALNRAIKDGTIDVTMAHDLAGIAQGEDQGVMWKIRPVMRWASFMFHHAEKFNRQATFIAAYRLAKEAGENKPRKPTNDELYEDAKKATYDGHFDYSASNRARVMQGNWQRVILLFKNYAQHMIYALARNAHQSIKAEKPEDRRQARETLGGLLATHAAAAGVLGLPIVGPLLTIASWIGGDDDEPWDAEVAMQNAMAELMGPKAAEVMARGLSRLTPFDLSGRVALNKLILPDVQEGLQGKEWAESAMAAALGPVAGIGINVARGVQKITEGDYMRGMEDMLPTALRGPIKALRYADEGAVDKTGIVITDEVSAAGVLGQASGFSPSQVRRDTERRSAIYGYDKALLERRSVLMRMFAEARIQGDNETAQEVQADIQKFNEKHPNRRITGMNLAQSIRNRRKRVAEAEQGVYLPSKRRDALEAVSF